MANAKGTAVKAEGKTRTKPKVRSGAEAVIEGLKAEGVEVMFGVNGGAIMPVYDVLYDTPEIRHITTGHEQGATHAAEGYARVTGKVGVVIATSGPGATNLITGLTDAIMDSLPIVALTGQVPTFMVGNDAFQEAPVRGITMSVTKHNYMVQQADDIPRVIQEAFHIARTGRPGPVLVDLPKDVTLAETRAERPERPKLEGYRPHYEGHPKQIREVVTAIQAANRPVIMAGGGVLLARASDELQEFAERLRIPVTTTHMAVGCFPEDNPLSLGSIGMHGTGYANKTVPNSDLVIGIGTRFSDRVTGKVETFAPDAKIVHIDIDPMEISKNVPIDIPIVGDARQVLQALNQETQGLTLDTEAWLKQVEAWKEEYPLRYDKNSDKLKPQYIVEELDALTERDAIVVTDVGQHQMWVLLFYTFTQPDTNVTSGGLGTMGFGFPAAIGAKIGKPERRVICVTGDGSFLMNIQELHTATRLQLPIVVLVFNNRSLGMVRQWQQFFHGGRFSESLLAPLRFDRIAEAFGAKGIRVERPEEVRSAIKAGLNNQEGPTVIDCIIDEHENVFPMVPPGGSIEAFIESEADVQ
ncbi:MAG: biosynthetic-type acetolactate synthase large subunit [Candidatus Bipolaricaulia bacterium]